MGHSVPQNLQCPPSGPSQEVFANPWVKWMLLAKEELYCHLSGCGCSLPTHRNDPFGKFQTLKLPCLPFFVGVLFPAGSVVKNLSANAGDSGSIPGSGRSPGQGNSNPLQCSCLEHTTERGAWWTTVHGLVKSLDTTAWLSNSKHHCLMMVCQFLLYNEVDQLRVCKYPLPPGPLTHLPHPIPLGHHRALSWAPHGFYLFQEFHCFRAQQVEGHTE